MASLALLLAACSINVDDKDKKNEKVDIQTPFANLKVNTERQGGRQWHSGLSREHACRPAG